jgi:hypothetical protein
MLTNDMKTAHQKFARVPGDRAQNAGMTTTVAQQRISRDLLNAEAALDEALLRQSRLLSTMVNARRETGSAPFVGQDALMRLVRSQQAMVNAGGELARVHGRLSDIAVEMVGGNDPCPTTGFGMDNTWSDCDNSDGTADLAPQSRAA